MSARAALARARRVLGALALAATCVAGAASCGDGPGYMGGDGGDADAAHPGCPPPSRSLSFVFAQIGFVREEPMRTDVADGFDLDGRVSRAGDSMTCRQGDLVSPTGATGIDNQLARLIPTVDMMTGGALDGAIQAAINNGQMLVVVTVDDLDDLCNDPEVNVRVQRVSGMPFVGSDMLVDPGQTFDLMRDRPVTRVRGRVVNGQLETEAVDLPLPVAILDAQFTIMFYGARMRIELSPQGTARGVIGGGLSLREFMAIAADFNIPDNLRNTVNSALQLFADLDRDAMGRCNKISGAMRLTVRPAFVLE